MDALGSLRSGLLLILLMAGAAVLPPAASEQSIPTKTASQEAAARDILLKRPDCIRMVALWIPQKATVWSELAAALVAVVQREPADRQLLWDIHQHLISLTIKKRNLKSALISAVEQQSKPAWQAARQGSIGNAQAEVRECVSELLSLLRQRSSFSLEKDFKDLRQTLDAKMGTLCELDHLAQQDFPLNLETQERLKTLLAALDSETNDLDKADERLALFIRANPNR